MEKRGGENQEIKRSRGDSAFRPRRDKDSFLVWGGENH